MDIIVVVVVVIVVVVFADRFLSTFFIFFFNNTNNPNPNPNPNNPHRIPLRSQEPCRVVPGKAAAWMRRVGCFCSSSSDTRDQGDCARGFIKERWISPIIIIIIIIIIMVTGRATGDALRREIPPPYLAGCRRSSCRPRAILLGDGGGDRTREDLDEEASTSTGALQENQQQQQQQQQQGQG